MLQTNHVPRTATGESPVVYSYADVPRFAAVASASATGRSASSARRGSRRDTGSKALKRTRPLVSVTWPGPARAPAAGRGWPPETCAGAAGGDHVAVARGGGEGSPGVRSGTVDGRGREVVVDWWFPRARAHGHGGGHAMPRWPRAGGEASTAAGPGGGDADATPAPR